MGTKRPYKKYDVVVDGGIVHSGITKDLDRRKQEHKGKWSKATVKQVGGSVTEKSARKWEKTKRKA